MSQGGWYVFLTVMFLSIFSLLNLMVLHFTAKRIIDKCGNPPEYVLLERSMN